MADSTGNPLPSHTLNKDMAVEMNSMVQMVDQDDRSVTTEEPTPVVVQPPDTADSNSVPSSASEVNMGVPFYRFSNHHKHGSYLNPP